MKNHEDSMVELYLRIGSRIGTEILMCSCIEINYERLLEITTESVIDSDIRICCDGFSFILSGNS